MVEISVFKIFKNIKIVLQRLEEAQMKILRHLPGITKLDKGKNHCIWEKTGARTLQRK